MSDYIKAIQAIRTATKCTLKEAKDAVDSTFPIIELDAFDALPKLCEAWNISPEQAIASIHNACKQNLRLVFEIHTIHTSDHSAYSIPQRYAFDGGNISNKVKL